jgi:serine/threonine protein kinase
MISSVRSAAHSMVRESSSAPHEGPPAPSAVPAPTRIECALIADRYRVLRTLASGGMGIVYACNDTLLARPVALKVMRGGTTASDQVMKERFLEEARLLAQVDSRHVTQIFDYGSERTGEPFLVMELLDGQDLGDLLAEQGPLAPAAVIHYIRQACEGLREVHRHHIVHRDLKPENLLMLPLPNGTELVKIIDFGISKRLGRRSSTEPSTNAGSPHYMAPEQLETPPELDARVDVWSLGVVMYELLTGHLPFDGPGMLEIFAAVIGAEPTPISSFRTDVPPELEQLVSRCLEKDPRRRYQSVDELDLDLAGIPLLPKSACVLDPAGQPSPVSSAGSAEEGGSALQNQPIDLVPKRSRRQRRKWGSLSRVAVAAALALAAVSCGPSLGLPWPTLRDTFARAVPGVLFVSELVRSAGSRAVAP